MMFDELGSRVQSIINIFEVVQYIDRHFHRGMKMEQLLNNYCVGCLNTKDLFVKALYTQLNNTLQLSSLI